MKTARFVVYFDAETMRGFPPYEDMIFAYEHFWEISKRMELYLLDVSRKHGGKKPVKVEIIF